MEVFVENFVSKLFFEVPGFLGSFLRPGRHRCERFGPRMSAVDRHIAEL